MKRTTLSSIKDWRHATNGHRLLPAQPGPTTRNRKVSPDTPARHRPDLSCGTLVNALIIRSLQSNRTVVVVVVLGETLGIMVVMPTWLSTILIALVTTVLTQLTVGPRLEARNRRIQTAHQARDAFSASVLTILAATGRLQAMQVPREASPGVRTALQGERQRWLAQIDEATRHLVDNVEKYALGYIRTAGMRNLVIQYAAVARLVWISERPQARRVELVQQLTAPVQGIFFAYIWWRLLHLADEKRTLVRLVGEFANPAQTPG